MTGQMVALPDVSRRPVRAWLLQLISFLAWMQDENTPEKRVNKLFEMMDKDKNQKLDFEGGVAPL